MGYVGLARSLLLNSDLHAALESVMRARKLYALVGTAPIQAAIAGSFESEVLIKLERYREALGSMQGAYKLALDAKGPGNSVVKKLRLGLDALSSMLGVNETDLTSQQPKD